MSMQAILYAAGVGRRLEEASGHKPKVLLELGGKTLLEWHCLRLSQSGIRSLTIVLGFQGGLIEAELGSWSGRYPLEIRTLVNPRFTEGSVLSFLASVPVLEGSRRPVLLMDADVLYPAEMLGRLLRSPHGTALLVDRGFSTEDDDPVLVPIDQGRPFDFVKRWQGQAQQVGESVGFFKLSPDDLPILIAESRRLGEAAPCLASYDDVLRLLVRQGRFGFEDVTDLPWTEIDFPKDLERARHEVLPAILRLG